MIYFLFIMSIYILSYLHFLTFIVYLFLSVYVVYKSPKSPLNWACALFNFSLCLWSVSFIVVHHPHSPESVAIFFMKFFSFTPYIITCFFLWFAVVFTNQNSRLLKNPLFYLFIFIFPVLFTYETWIGEMIYLASRPYGWAFEWTDSFYNYLYFGQYASFVLIAIFLLARAYRHNTDFGRRTQILWVLIPTVIIYIIGTFTNVIFPVLNVRVPQVANITSLVWAFGIFYAVMKFKFLTVSFSAYSDKVIAIMREALILLDIQDNIVNANEAAFKLFGHTSKEMIGKNAGVFIDKEYLNSDDMKGGGSVKTKQITVLDGQKKPVPVIFSSSALTDKVRTIGRVIAFSNIGELVEAQKNTELLNQELKQKIEEMEKFQKIAVDRELKMVELKKEIEKLKTGTGI